MASAGERKREERGGKRERLRGRETEKERERLRGRETEN